MLLIFFSLVWVLYFPAADFLNLRPVRSTPSRGCLLGLWLEEREDKEAERLHLVLLPTLCLLTCVLMCMSMFMFAHQFVYYAMKGTLALVVEKVVWAFRFATGRTMWDLCVCRMTHQKKINLFTLTLASERKKEAAEEKRSRKRKEKQEKKDSCRKKVSPQKKNSPQRKREAKDSTQGGSGGRSPPACRGWQCPAWFFFSFPTATPK